MCSPYAELWTTHRHLKAGIPHKRHRCAFPAEHAVAHGETMVAMQASAVGRTAGSSWRGRAFCA